jgi:feruloyl esterase
MHFHSPRGGNLTSTVTSAAACTLATFSQLGPFLANTQTLSVTAVPVYNWSYAIRPSDYPAHFPQNVTDLNFCNVSVVYTHPDEQDTLRVWVWLPLDTWNGRLQGLGGGGFVGGLIPGSLAGAVNDGYAAVSTDGGHSDPDASTWAWTGPGNVDLYATQDFGSVSLPEAAAIGKAVTNSFYGSPAKYTYFNGCSGGGRQAMMLTQRYPDAYNGILVGAPGIDFAHGLIAGLYWEVQTQTRGRGFPSPCEMYYISLAAVAACDALDGVEDGIVSFPERCPFDPHLLVGTPAVCSAALQSVIGEVAADAAVSIWKGAYLQDGEKILDGLDKGALLNGALDTVCWSDDNSTDCHGLPIDQSTQFLQYWVEKNATFDWSALDETEFEWAYRQAGAWAGMTSALDPDLSRVRALGGKIIHWHGMADPLIPTGTSRDYYDNALQLDPNLRDFYRFFEAPGVSHCEPGGPAP